MITESRGDGVCVLQAGLASHPCSRRCMSRLVQRGQPQGTLHATQDEAGEAICAKALWLDNEAQLLCCVRACPKLSLRCPLPVWHILVTQRVVTKVRKVEQDPEARRRVEEGVHAHESAYFTRRAAYLPSTCTLTLRGERHHGGCG